jgi:hypothetical protein
MKRIPQRLQVKQRDNTTEIIDQTPINRLADGPAV